MTGKEICMDCELWRTCVSPGRAHEVSDLILCPREKEIEKLSTGRIGNKGL